VRTGPPAHPPAAGGAQRRDAKIDHPVVIRLRAQPLPGAGQRGAVYRVVVALLDLIRAHHHRGRGFDGASHAVEAPEALAQRIQAGAFGDQGVEIEVSADFQCLRGHHQQGRAELSRGGMGRAQRTQAFGHGVVPVQIAHAAGQQDDRVAMALAQPGGGFPGGRHAVAEHHDGPWRLRDEFARRAGQHLGKRGRCGSAFGLGGLQQARGLLGQYPFAERMRRVGRLAGGVTKHILDVRRWRGGQDGDMKRRQRWLIGPGPVGRDAAQGVQKRLRAMRLVEQNQRVVAGQSGQDRPGLGGATVATKQQPRA